MGGGYISAGLPMYVDLNQKPDSGGEIQNIADVKSGIMLRLKIVKSATENKAIATEDLAAAAADGDDNEMDESGRKGTKVLLELTKPWHNTGRLVGGNAYFVSVEAAVAVKVKGMSFIGNVKQCHKKFPMPFLSNTILCQRGSRSVLASISESARRPARRSSSRSAGLIGTGNFLVLLHSDLAKGKRFSASGCTS
jgi:hypothetical protein